MMILCALFSILVAVSGKEVAVNDWLFSGDVEFIDLTHPYNNHSIQWPGEQRFVFTKKHAGKGHSGIWYSANEFCTAEHSGTHIDAPYHFNSSQWTLGQIPFQNFITPLIVIDVSSKVKDDSKFVVKKQHIEQQLNNLTRSVTVIFKFGWSKYYNDITKYFGTPSPQPDNLVFPGISEEVALWLVESKKVVGVGVDTASVDPGSVPALAHLAFASNNMFMLENVKIDMDISSNKCGIMVMPMKIQDGTGGPCRLTAICPKNS